MASFNFDFIFVEETSSFAWDQRLHRLSTNVSTNEFEGLYFRFVSLYHRQEVQRQFLPNHVN